MSTLGAVLKAPLRAALAWRPVRQRIAFELRYRYYGDLENRIPLTHGFVCPLAFADAWCSFAEIFVRGEYGAALEETGLPDRWIDLGCHAGYFSLYVAWQRARNGRDAGAALLVDADSRMGAAVEELIALNSLGGRFSYVHGAIANGDGDRAFSERGYMASSLEGLGTAPGEVKQVSVLPAAEIVARFPPPYDLVKIDIEGAEREFAANYDAVLAETRMLLLEWHEGAAAPRAVDAIRDQLARRGFGTVRELSTRRNADQADLPSAGLLLARRTR